MTEQDAFDKVWNWFVVDRNPASVVPMGYQDQWLCQYRNPTGAKCAVGVLITDGEMEFVPETSTPEDVQDICGWSFEKYFVRALQTTHDTAALCTMGPRWPAPPDVFLAGIEANLRHLAQNYCLVVPASEVS